MEGRHIWAVRTAEKALYTSDLRPAVGLPATCLSRLRCGGVDGYTHIDIYIRCRQDVLLQ